MNLVKQPHHRQLVQQIVGKEVEKVIVDDADDQE